MSCFPKNEPNYHEILLKLRRRTEMASRLLSASGGLDIFEYALALSESVLEALDDSMCYPDFEILENLMEVMEIEKEQY